MSMKELFQIKDYIRISSTDYLAEFKDKLIHFEKPSRDVKYWSRNCHSHDADIFRKFLDGVNLQIHSNELTVELPKELVGQIDDAEKMVQFIPLPQKILDCYKITVQVVPDSVRWKAEGRCIKIQFSTQVSLDSPITRFEEKELRRGVWCCATNALKVVREIMLDPDNVEYFSAAHDSYLIRKSMDESVQRRKFYLMYHDYARPTERGLESVAKNFSSGIVFPEEMDFPLGGKGYRFEKHPYSYSPYVRFSGYRIDAYGSFKSGEDARLYLQSLEVALRMSLDAVDAHQEGRLDLQFEIHEGTFTFFVDERELKTSKIAELKKELRFRAENIRSILEFLTKELEVEKTPEKSMEEILLDYIFYKIWLDPLSYTDDSVGPFRKYALQLV